MKGEEREEEEKESEEVGRERRRKSHSWYAPPSLLLSFFLSIFLKFFCNEPLSVSQISFIFPLQRPHPPLVLCLFHTVFYFKGDP